jgi:hypothetical protein
MFQWVNAGPSHRAIEFVRNANSESKGQVYSNENNYKNEDENSMARMDVGTGLTCHKVA